MTYRLRRAVGAPAEVVGAELERINAECGGVTPPVVIEQARPDDAPLHPCFTWDDAKAAHGYRLIEARNLIRAVHVVDESGADEGCAFVHVSEANEDSGVYRPMAEVVADPDMFATAARGLAHRLHQARRALADLEAAAQREGNKKRARGVTRALKATTSATQALEAVI